MYFDRPGIDGEALLATFAPRATASTSDRQFIDTLLLVSHNFADPHFIDITGRPFEALSPAQIGFAFNVALAGHRQRPRTLEVIDAGRRRTFALAATSDHANRIKAGPLLDVSRQGALGIIRINNALGDQALAGTTTLLLDLRNTPSGGNTSVARGIMGHFIDRDRPYQMHVIPYESRFLGPARKFVEYVEPFGTHYAGRGFVAGGRWTGSMGKA